MKEGNIYELITGRRAIRRYQNRPVPRATVEELLSGALWAPSAHNRQPWRFAVLLNEAPKQRLAKVMGERLRQDRLKDGDNQDAIERDVARSYARITGAPVVIVFFLTMSVMDHYPDPGRNSAERCMATQSVAMAVQNLWLLATAKGLGACWLCAPLFVPDLVNEVLEVPA
ncbi:MAG: nitroreductase family protein, partial [Candidatus Promineifilaceae bacterium]